MVIPLGGYSGLFEPPFGKDAIEFIEIAVFEGNAAASLFTVPDGDRVAEEVTQTVFQCVDIDVARRQVGGCVRVFL